ncbi:3'-5' exonuclease [Veillonella agrestimuris]|uniref:3'-5' exonuclease n=1 Tax=Veillonella agrestimuris TaxID=2941340 RepID=UPI002041D99D|nr:3'-5' exonuclease [Veillonella agrestimuris]
MNYIVFDLEWNQPYSNDISFMKRTKMPIRGEIIQIGAVKLNEQLDIVDTFTVYIKPKFLTSMHKHVKKLTGITQNELNMGVPFVLAYNNFKLWCGDDYMLLSWGVDDILMLRENLLLHTMKSVDYHQWADIQVLYSYERHGIVKQFSLASAVKDLGVTNDKLSAHNALHDAIFTAHVCQKIDLNRALMHYDVVRKEAPNPFLYPPGLIFFMYENFLEKKRIVYDRKGRISFCPYCQHRLESTNPERMQGDYYLSIGICPKHGEFAIQLKVGKYTNSSGESRFYLTKVLSHSTDEIIKLYTEKSALNREKERRYQERRRLQLEQKKG